MTLVKHPNQKSFHEKVTLLLFDQKQRLMFSIKGFFNQCSEDTG